MPAPGTVLGDPLAAGGELPLASVPAKQPNVLPLPLKHSIMLWPRYTKYMVERPGACQVGLAAMARSTSFWISVPTSGSATVPAWGYALAVSTQVPPNWQLGKTRAPELSPY